MTSKFLAFYVVVCDNNNFSRMVQVRTSVRGAHE